MGCGLPASRRRPDVLTKHVAWIGMAWLSLSSLATFPPRSDAKPSPSSSLSSSSPLSSFDTRPRSHPRLGAFISMSKPWGLRICSPAVSPSSTQFAFFRSRSCALDQHSTHFAAKPRHRTGRAVSTIVMAESGRDLLSLGAQKKGGVDAATQRVDFTTLSALVTELQAELPLKVGGVCQSGEAEVTLSFVEQGEEEEEEEERDKDKWLLLSWNRDSARLCLLQAPPFPSSAASSLSRLLSSYTSSLYLVSAALLPFSSTVELDFSSNPAPPQPSVEDEDEMEGQEGGGKGVLSGMSETEEEEEQRSREGQKEEEEEEEQEQRCKIVLTVEEKGQSRLLLVDDKGRVVTAAPAADRRGNVFHRIGKLYPAPLPAKEGGKEEEEEGRKRKKGGGKEEGEEGGVALAREKRTPSLEESQADWQKSMEEAARDSPAVSVKAALLNSYQGLSGRLIDEMLWAAGIPASEQVSTMQQEDYVALWQAWRGWLWALADCNFVGTLRQGQALPGYSVIRWPEPASFDDEETQSSPIEELTSDDGWDGGVEDRAVRVTSTVSECVASYYELAELEAVQKRLLAALQGGIKRQRAKITDFQLKLAEAAGAERYKALGTALAANQHLVKVGMSKVEVPDWEGISERSSTVPTIQIELDPKLNAADNAAKLFKRYKKLVRQEGAVQSLLDDATKALMDLVETEGAVQNVPYGEGARTAKGVLAELEQRLVQRGILKAGASEDGAQAKAAALLRERAERKGEKTLKLRGRGKGPAPNFLRFESPSGLQVVAGRSSRQNDRVTWGLARDRDLWFHARGIGGSHVVLVLPPGSSPSGEDIKFAAQIAAFYSKAKAETRVDVSYTERKYLRPPPQKYKKPGMVFITKEQVVTVRPKDWKKINDES